MSAEFKGTLADGWSNLLLGANSRGVGKPVTLPEGLLVGNVEH